MPHQRLRHGKRRKKKKKKKNGKGAQAAVGGDLDGLDDGDQFLLVSCGCVRCGRYIRHTIDDSYLPP